MGISDFWGKSENLVVIEWAEKAEDALPPDTIWIKFENIDDSTRKITVE